MIIRKYARICNHCIFFNEKNNPEATRKLSFSICYGVEDSKEDVCLPRGADLLELRPSGPIRKMVSDYFAEIINSTNSVLLVISFDYYFQIIFRLFSDYFQIIIYDLGLLFMISDYFIIIF